MVNSFTTSLTTMQAGINQLQEKMMEMEARAAQRESNRPKSNQRGRKQASPPPGSDSEGIPALRVHTIANEDTSEDEDSDGPPTRKPSAT